MESTTPLTLYLEKLASGERELAPLICEKLSHQLVYVPVCVGGKSNSDGKLIFQVVKLPEGNIPVFTTEQQYKEWATSNPESTEVFTVLGGDLCATVGERATVILDIGSSHSSVLDYALMQLIASAAGEALIEERTLRIDNPPPQVPDSVAPVPVVPQRPVSEPMFATSESLSSESESSEEAAQPGFEPEILRGRSNPTSIMPRPARPRVNLDRDVHHRSKLPSGGFKPVITTEDPDSAKLIRTKEDPKKGGRRSLLKFLGG